MTEYKKFERAGAFAPDVTVHVRRKDDLLDREDKITINWSCCGAVAIEDAEIFFGQFKKAIAYAKKEQNKINRDNWKLKQ